MAEFGLLALTAFQVGVPVVEIVLHKALPGRRFKYWQTRASKALKIWNALESKAYVPSEDAAKMTKLIRVFDDKSKEYRNNHKELNRKQRFGMIKFVKEVEKNIESLITVTSHMAMAAEADCMAKHRALYDAHGRCPECIIKSKTSLASAPTSESAVTLPDPTLFPGFVSQETRTVLQTNGFIREITTRTFRPGNSEPLAAGLAHPRLAHSLDGDERAVRELDVSETGLQITGTDTPDN
ncbi:hypothetical protein B0H10DRAFT_2002921 [Mycena sp. CBHHK59/15]|nr:hypothetical protein B0H10DRAFT_2002921 [Mycena sp. CBHHK59/15]